MIVHRHQGGQKLQDMPVERARTDRYACGFLFRQDREFDLAIKHLDQLIARGVSFPRGLP